MTAIKTEEEFADLGRSNSREYSWKTLDQGDVAVHLTRRGRDFEADVASADDDQTLEILEPGFDGFRVVDAA